MVITGGPTKRTDDKFAERCLFWYLALTPVWWATGLLVPIGFFGITILFFRRPPQDSAVTGLVVLWCLAGAAQALAGAVNWDWQKEPWMLLPYRTLNMPVLGWILLGFCIGVGAENHLVSDRVVRGFNFLGGYILLIGVVSYVAAIGLSMNELTVPSPVAFLLPKSLPSVQADFTMRFFIADRFLGYRVPRLILFYPWSTGLGIAGMTIMLLAPRDPSWGWRTIGFVGGLFGLASSLSRAAIVVMVVVMAIVVIARMGRASLLLAIALGALAVNFLLLWGWDPILSYDNIYRIIMNARAGSTEARNLSYAMSWEGFLTSPIFGHGWVGEIYSPEIPIPTGSTSTFYGVLYTGGLTTFCLVALAYVGTLVLALRRCLRSGYNGAAALGMWLAVGMLAYGEGMYSLVPALLAVFVWLGGALARPRVPDDSLPLALGAFGNVNSIDP